MLVTFSCKAHGNITMLGDVALKLIKLMGHSGTVPSAILAKDVPAALAQLQESIDHTKKKQTVSKSTEDNDEDAVSLRHRALPLINLLQHAVQENCDVLWK